MSGGHYDYQQRRILDITDSIERYVADNDYDFTPETIAKMQEGVKALRIAYVYAQRIDWLLSGDDGEESFHERLNKDLCQI